MFGDWYLAGVWSGRNAMIFAPFLEYFLHLPSLKLTKKAKIIPTRLVFYDVKSQN